MEGQLEWEEVEGQLEWEEVEDQLEQEESRAAMRLLPDQIQSSPESQRAHRYLQTGYQHQLRASVGVVDLMRR